MRLFFKNAVNLSVKFWALLFAITLCAAMLPKTKKLDSPDFKVFYVAARHALVDPVNLYKISPDRYLYPPSTSILLIPAAFTSNWHLHQWIWHAFLGFLVFFLASRSYAALFSMLLLMRYEIINFGYGQINLLILTLLLLTQLYLDKGAHKRAGALWAVVSSIKIYPLVLGMGFLLRRDWWGLLAAIAAGVCVLALPFLFFGSSLGYELYREFFLGLADKGLPLHSHNQSFAGLFLRLGTSEVFELHGIGKVSWGFLPIGATAAKCLAWALGGSLTIVSWWRARMRGEGYLSAAAFSILFLSHLVWKDYLLFLYFPLVELLGEESIPRNKRIQGALIFLALVTLTSSDILGARTAAVFDAASIHLWGAVLVWVAWISYLSPFSSLRVMKST